MEIYEEREIKWLIDKPGGLFLRRRRLEPTPSRSEYVDTKNTLDVNDKELLPQLAGGKDFAEAKTSNSADAFGVFKFAADNSNAEWRVAGYNNKNKGTDFVINTDFHTGDVISRDMDKNQSDMIFQIHSHPGAGDYSKKASGYFDGLNYESGTDMGTMADYYNAAKAVGKDFPSGYPRFYIYHKATEGVYNYNYKTNSSYIGNVKTPITLRSLINRHRIK